MVGLINEGELDAPNVGEPDGRVDELAEGELVDSVIGIYDG